MLKREKLIIGVVGIILGGTIAVTSVVFGLKLCSKCFYADIDKYSIRLSGQKEEAVVGLFLAKREDVLSFWLKVPDRRIENQNFKLVLKIYDRNNQAAASFRSDFSYGYFRDGSAGQGQYYLLGAHRFENDFWGVLKYVNEGDWIAPYNGLIVIRTSGCISPPYREILICILGALIFLQSFIVVLRNRTDEADKNIASK